MHVHAFSMYISAAMLNHIQEQVSVMSQLTAQLCFQSLHHYTLSQLHNITAALDIIAASSLLYTALYKKLSDITEHTPKTDA